MAVEAAHRGIAEEDAAAPVGLQPVLVRVDHDRVGLGDPIVRAAALAAEVRREAEVAAVGRVRVQAESIAVSKRENPRQRVDRSDRGRSDGRDDGSHAAGVEAALEGREIHPALAVARNVFEGHPEDPADPRVRVVRLLGCHDGGAGTKLSADPQRFEVRHRPAAGQVAEVRLHPNIRARSATASFSMAELARPPSRAWLFGLIHIASAYASRATACGGFSICPA